MQPLMGMSFFMIQDSSNLCRPKCPQPQFPLRLEDGLIGLPPGIATHSQDIFDEFDCLNLNITTPAGANEKSDLPVFIYIHGGGGFSGSNGDWWCDGGSIVKRSMEIGKPVIAVAIKYMLFSHRFVHKLTKMTATVFPFWGILVPKNSHPYTGKEVTGIKVRFRLRSYKSEITNLSSGLRDTVTPLLIHQS